MTYGVEGFSLERRGRGGKGAPPKISKEVEEDLLAEVQRLRSENDYLKKLECLGFQKGTVGEKSQVISKLRHKHKLSLLLKVSEIPRSTYYYYVKRQAARTNTEKLKK